MSVLQTAVLNYFKVEKFKRALSRFWSKLDFISLLFSLSLFTQCVHADTSGQVFRLTKDVQPLSYDIFIHPHLNNETFQGRVSIVIDIFSKQSVIRLHQRNLTISSIYLKKLDGANIEITKNFTNNTSENLIVELKEELNTGKYDLNLTFSGFLDSKILGFYTSKYKDENNKTRTMAVSHFEPTYARQAFPCFDEPSFKAEFSIKLVHPNDGGYSALSNMNVENVTIDKPEPGFTTVSFAKTVPMSTYTICFIVSDLVSATKEATRLDGSKFPVTIYISKAEKEKGIFILETAVKVIEYYSRLFGTEYSLPKMDMAVIPDYSSPAMENWGLITYKKEMVVDHETIPSFSKNQSIVELISHEVSHNWFGNLVTMKWWDDLWLSEGFATFFKYKGAHAIFPNSGFMDSFLLKAVHQVLKDDARSISRSIVAQNVNPTESIRRYFDSMTYKKGSSILRMLESFVGADNFYAGLSNYLKKFAYKNAESKDLFDCIQSATNNNEISINSIMDTWTRQKGLPLVNVKKDELTYTLTQKRLLQYTPSTSDAEESPFGYRWTIPITYTTSKNSSSTLVWFDKDAQNLVITLKEPVDWIKFNDQQIGFYRVNYDRSGWKTLIDALCNNHEQLPVHDRVHLLDDAFNLVYARELNYSIALSTTLYLYNETSYAPWYVASNAFKTLNDVLSFTKTSDKLSGYIKKLVDKTYQHVTWNFQNTETADTLALRPTLLELACFFGHPKCREDAGAMFKAWINDEKDVRPHPDIREIVYNYGMMYAGNETDWNIMLARFVAENRSDEKNRLLQGLASSNLEYIVKKFIDLIFDEHYVRSEDVFFNLYKIWNCPDNKLSGNLVWHFVRDNWDLLIKRYSVFDLSFGAILPFMRMNFVDKAKMDEVESFARLHPEIDYMDFKNSTLNELEAKSKWSNAYLEQVDQWLDQHL